MKVTLIEYLYTRHTVFRNPTHIWMRELALRSHETVPRSPPEAAGLLFEPKPPSLQTELLTWHQDPQVVDPKSTANENVVGKNPGEQPRQHLSGSDRSEGSRENLPKKPPASIYPLLGFQKWYRHLLTTFSGAL